MRYASSATDSSKPTTYSGLMPSPSQPLEGPDVEPREPEEGECERDHRDVVHERPQDETYASKPQDGVKTRPGGIKTASGTPVMHRAANVREYNDFAQEPYIPYRDLA
jgi:hypothetical protein